MASTLYDISVASSLQMLGGVSNFLQKGADYFAENDLDPAECVSTRLKDDMAPFHFQVISCVHHSLGSIKGVMAGEFGPPSGYADYDYAGLQGFIGETIKELEGMTADEVNALEGKPVSFKMGKNEIPFTAENFVLSFSHPNLYFHAATTYDILRMKGVPLGKIDFLGPLRIKK